MGYERKRGKLGELNALLRGGAADAFCLIVGDTALLAGVKYVITLDTDTQLPRDSAREFVGTMAHPLNRPRYDEQKKLVVDGYGNCLVPTDPDATPPDLFSGGNKVSKLVVRACSGDTTSKWNAPPNILQPLPLKDIGEK